MFGVSDNAVYIYINISLLGSTITTVNKSIKYLLTIIFS